MFCLVCLVDCLAALLWVFGNCAFRFVLQFATPLVLLYLVVCYLGVVVPGVGSLVSWLVVGVVCCLVYVIIWCLD